MEEHLGIIARQMKSNGKVRSACTLCQNFCGLFAYVENGMIVRLEGDPDNPRNKGHLCAKGLSGFVNAYSPHRVKRPLIRTNPEKGIGVDPNWQQISWEQAIGIVAEKVKLAKEKTAKQLEGRVSSSIPTSRVDVDPWSQRIILDTFDHWTIHSRVHRAWVLATDAYQSSFSANYYCGNAVHPPSFLNTATFEVTVDPEYSKYVLLVGAQAGSIIHYDTMNVARHIAEKRPGEIKVVVVDPMAGYAASKAEEWVPIRPGTDAAFLLALVNLLLNEYGIYDAEFLKKKTNAPYLIGEDGSYARDPTTKKPIIWDSANHIAKTFDDPNIKDYALDGVYNVDDRSCTPSLQIVKDHVRKYSPEKVSEITTVPADTIRRIARELGEAACIGQTITIDGKEFPYRPVSVTWYRGLSAHRHSYLAGLAAVMLPTIIGAIQVPGGVQGHPSYPEYVTEDGLMATKPWLGTPYPPRRVSKPRRVDAYELFPVGVYSTALIPAVLNHPERFGIDQKEFVWPEIMFIFRDNVVKNSYAPEEVVAGLKKIPFIVTFNIDLDDTANSLADIVFPDIHHLEKLGEDLSLKINEPGLWYAGKPAVPPPFDPPWNTLRSNTQIFLEIAKQAGFLSEMYDLLNSMWNLKGTPYEINPNEKHSYEELADRRLKSWLGPDKGLEWLMSDEGGLIVSEAKPEERWKGPFRKGRLHVYYEFMLQAKNDVEKTVGELGIKWDTGDYQPIPDWKPCPSYSKRNPKYNLSLINYKIPIVAHSVGMTNPLPRQLLGARRHLDAVLIHPDTAAKLSIKDGEEIIVETWKGRRQKGMAYLTERVHPEVVASSQHKSDRGINFNYLATLDDDTFDFVSAAVDACLLVRVSKT